eukprot:4559425-Pyramimonas_sp.AAC.1
MPLVCFTFSRVLRRAWRPDLTDKSPAAPQGATRWPGGPRQCLRAAPWSTAGKSFCSARRRGRRRRAGPPLCSWRGVWGSASATPVRIQSLAAQSHSKRSGRAPPRGEVGPRGSPQSARTFDSRERALVPCDWFQPLE